MPSSAAATSPKTDRNERSFASLDEALERANGLVERLRARAADVDTERRITDESIADIGDTGLFRISAPRMFGGSQFGISPLIQTVATIASGCGSTGWVYAVLSGHNWAVGLFPEKAQREVFSDPDALVASIVRLGGNAPKKVEGGYLFEDAAGKFCSGIEHAKWIMVGAGVATGTEAPEPRYFLIPKSEIEIIDDWYTAGLRGTRSCSLKVKRSFVPEHRSVSIPEIAKGTAPGMVLHDSPVYRAPFPQILPFPLAGVPIGLARAALEIFINGYRGKLKNFVSEQIAEQSAVLARISDVHAEVASATALVFNDTVEIDAVADGTKISAFDRARYVRNAAYGANKCRYAVTSLFEASGGSGIYDTFELQRIWRDVNAAAAHNAFMRDKLDPAFSRALLGLPASKFDRIGH
ncbi:MAG TPA: acyl-CoA dehydrogenase family protein [Xanthobacteraceae bacterium]|nr:acyl-CoA dehydrogenase family protein [Xanthobacteraceae bacterium]